MEFRLGLGCRLLRANDDLNRLAAQNVVYLARAYLAQGPGVNTKSLTEVWRGRLRQILSGNWIFNAFTGGNGVVGFDLGAVAAGGWTSTETPVGGLQVTISTLIYPIPTANGAALTETITLTTLIPADFAE